MSSYPTTTNTARRRQPGAPNSQGRDQMTHRIARRSAVGLLAAVAAALPMSTTLTETADAGTYTAYACDVPGVNLPAPSRGGWMAYDTSGQIQHWDDCTSKTVGGSVAFQINYPTGVLGQNTGVGLQLTIPSSGPQSAISIARVTDWSTTALTPQGAGQAPAYGLGLAPGISAAPGGDSSGWNGTSATGPGHDSGALAANTKSHRLGVYCAYYGGGYNNCTLPSPFLRIRGIRTTLEESVRPTGTIDGGSLTTAGAKAGTRTVAYTANDAESGVERVQVLLDGVVVGSESFARDLTLPVDQQSGACSYVGPQACPTTQSSVISVDTTQASEGTHELALRVFDAANNSRTTLLASEVTIDNHPAPAATTQPAVTGHAKVPNELVADDGSWSGATGAAVRQWESCDTDASNCRPLAGQVASRLTLTPELVGRRVRVAVTRSNAAGEVTTERSALTAAIAAPDGAECLSCGTRRVAAPGAPSTGSAGSLAPANGAGASRLARVTATFRGQRKRTVSASFSRRLTVSGALRDEHGKAITDAVLIVSARERAPGAPPTVLAMPRTAADGSYSYRLPVGPSRDITVAYKPNLDDPRPSSEAALATTVRASLTARTAPAVRLRGRLQLRGALRHLPRAGVTVKIQALDGRTWRTIGEVKTGRRGAYRWAYRFRNSGSAGRRFMFRTRVDDRLYPFAAGNSRAVSVHVRP